MKIVCAPRRVVLLSTFTGITSAWPRRQLLGGLGLRLLALVGAATPRPLEHRLDLDATRLEAGGPAVEVLAELGERLGLPLEECGHVLGLDLPVLQLLADVVPEVLDSGGVRPAEVLQLARGIAQVEVPALLPAAGDELLEPRLRNVELLRGRGDRVLTGGDGLSRRALLRRLGTRLDVLAHVADHLGREHREILPQPPRGDLRLDELLELQLVVLVRRGGGTTLVGEGGDRDQLRAGLPADDDRTDLPLVEELVRHRARTAVDDLHVLGDEDRVELEDDLGVGHLLRQLHRPVGGRLEADEEGPLEVGQRDLDDGARHLVRADLCGEGCCLHRTRSHAVDLPAS